jgi:raffinose/stachyose/melibiose transport system permease protein
MAAGDANISPVATSTTADRSTARRGRTRFRWRHVALYILLTAFMLVVILPFLSISLAALKTPEELVKSAFTLPSAWRWSNYAEAWQGAHFNRYFVNSVVVALPVVLVSTLFSVLSGYAFGRFSFPLSRLLFIVFLIGIMAPQEAYIISLYYLMDRIGLIDTYWAMILPQIGMSVCFGTFWMRGYFERVPRDMIDAARVDGCNSFSVLWRVIMPNAGAAVSTLVVLLFLWTWNDFLVPLVLTTSDTVKTLPLGLAFFQGRYQANVPLIAAGATIVALPTILVYIMFQRKFIQGITSGSVRG